MKRLRYSLRSAGAFTLLASLSASVAYAQYAGASPVPKDFKAGFDSITQSECKGFLSYLAGPECNGRGTGQEGFQKAAEFVAARFKEFGLKPIGENGSYFQNVPFRRRKTDTSASFVEIDGTNDRFAENQGLRFTNVRDTDATAEVAVVQVNDPEKPIAGSDQLKGKFVILVGKPSSSALRRALFGAEIAGTITVVDKLPEVQGTIMRGGAGGGVGRRPGGGGSVGLSITPATLRRWSESLGIPDAATSMGGDENKVFAAKGKLKVVSKVIDEDIKVPNVVGLLEGSDKVLKDEVVGVGAHLDHLGIQNGVVFWGADDDGSGTTAMLSIARAFSKNKVKPKRSILFMAFCGEEMGLIGSGYYTDNPIIPLEKQICLLQMDMVGRNEESANDKAADNVKTIALVGSKRISTELHDLILKTNDYVKFDFKFNHEDVYTRSDHYNFARKGVPISFIFSGFHPDYHQPTDTIEKINFEKLSNAAKLYYLVAFEAANRDKPFAKDVKN